MSEGSLPSPMQRQCKAVQPPERSMNAIIKYTEESSPMRLDGAVEYFGLRVAMVFRVIEGAYCIKEREGVTMGDIFIVYLKKAASFLKLKSGNDPVNVPVVTRTEFALMPLSEEGNETDGAIRSWEGVYQSVTEFFEAKQDRSMPMPAALKVLDNALDHNGKKVPAKTILFNIRQVSQRVGLRKRRGIEGVDCSGVVHRFLEGEDPLYFSTRLCDVKCIPGYFRKVLQFPQTARVYLHSNTEEEEEEVNLLQNLSTVTITEVSHGHHLVVRKLSDDGNHLGPAFTVPLTADLKVVAIKLKESHLLDNISDQRCMANFKPKVKATKVESCEMEKLRDATKERRSLPLPPTPPLDEHEHVESSSSPGVEDLYAVLQELQQCIERTNSEPTPSTIDELTEAEENNGTDPPISLTKAELPGNSVDTPTDDSGYTRVCVTTLSAHAEHGHKAPDAETEQVAPERLDGSLPGGQGNRNPPTTTVVQRSPLVRHNTAPPHRTPSPWRRRRNTVGKVSNLQRFSSAQSTGLDAYPTEQQLFHHVARRLGADWKHFAIYLGFESTDIQQADKEKSFTDKAYDILVAWRRGTGNKPRNWATILTALKSTGLTDLAHEIQRDIEGGPI